MKQHNRMLVVAEEHFEMSSQGLNLKTNSLPQPTQALRQQKSSKLSPNGLQRANWELALKRSNNKRNRYYKGKEVQLMVDIEHFKMYGTGIYLFFSFTKGLVVIFLILSILYLAPTIFNYLEGKGLQNSSTSFNYYLAKTTIANFDSSTDTNSSFHKLFNAIPNMIGISLFVMYYFFWLYRSDSLAKEVRQQVKLKSYYVLELIDPPSHATEQDILKFMSQFGKVAEIAAVNNYSESIGLSKKIYDQEIEIKALQMKGKNEGTAQYEEQIVLRKKQIDQTYKELVLYEDDIKSEVFKYYVTFSTMEERDKAFKQLEPHLKASCICLQKNPPQQYLLLGQRVEVTLCHTEPGQIIWQNQHITWRSRWLRSIIQFVVLLVIISFGFIFIQLMNLLTPSSSTLAVDTSAYNSTSILQESNSTIAQSWCLGNQQAALDSSTSALYSLCFSYIRSYYMKILITIGISLSVIIMKELIKKIVIKIAKFQRYKTHTDQSKDIIQNLFLTYTTTTVLITLLLQAKFVGISFKNVVGKLVNISTITENANSNQQYEDFVANWYLDIGYQILITWVVMILHPVMTMPPVLYLLEKWKYYSASSQEIQAKMQAKIEPPEFELEDHYANVLMIVTVCLTFSAGMPLIIIVGFFALLARHLYCKYLFIRYSKIPKTIDESLNTKMTRIIPYGILLHFGFAIWMFGVSSIFKRDSTFVESWTKNIQIAFFKQISFILQRLFGTWYYSALFVIVFMLFMFKIIVYNLIVSSFIDDTTEITQIKVKGITPGQEESVSQQMQPISSKNLCDSYKIENNPDYRQILEIRQAKSKFKVKTKSPAQ